MATKALGLAEHEIKHLDVGEYYQRSFVCRFVSEPPCFRLIRHSQDPYSDSSEYWYVPFPWTHYLLIKVANGEHWSLGSLYMSPRHLTRVRFRAVSAPIVPNIFDYGDDMFVPCQDGGGRSRDINAVIAYFWDGGFNKDLSPNRHPIVRKIAGRSTPPFSPAYFRKWEKLSIDKLLNMKWPQNIRI